MDKKNKEELKSRREFFKSAAKAALPVVGAVILASPIAHAATTPNGCTKYGCGLCTNSCEGNCKGGCQTTCSGGCKHYACKGVAKK